MDPLIADLIKTISLESIKILGPAVIAAYATYRATKTQYEIKLQELTKSHEFKARENLFDYYKNRQQKLSKSHEELNNTLGQILGMAATVDDEMESKSIDNLQSSYMSIAKLYAGLIPSEIDTTLADLEKKGLSNTPEYKKLAGFREIIKNIRENIGFEQLKENIFIMLEIYSFLERGNQLLLARQIEGVFSKYIDGAAESSRS